MRSSTAEYQRLRRQKRAAEGACRTCASKDPDRKPAPGYRCCHVCLERSAQDYQRQANKLPARDSFCIDCSAHGFHRDGCINQRRTA